jgi:hypothetical protein
MSTTGYAGASHKFTEQGKSKKLKGKRKKKKNGLKPLNLFMERNKNIYFEQSATRNNTSLSNPLNLFMGIYFLLFTFYFLKNRISTSDRLLLYCSVRFAFAKILDLCDHEKLL